MDCNDHPFYERLNMSIGIFRGEHSFTAIINQTDKHVTPLNPFDNHARALVKTPGIKPCILASHEAFVNSIVKQPGVITLTPYLWKVTVKYKYFGLRTTVLVQPSTN